MQKKILLYLLPIYFLFSCSTGQQAMKKGNNYEAVTTALDRLQKKSADEKAQEVLRYSYPLFVKEKEQIISSSINSSNPLKWENVQKSYRTMNNVNKKIQLIPIATSIIPNSKDYGKVIKDTEEKIMQARYDLGLSQLKEDTRRSAIKAYEHFSYILRKRENYKDTKVQLEKAKEIATITVGLTPIPMSHLKYQLSTDFFANQLYEYLNTNNRNRFVQFIFPSHKDFEQIQKDHLVEISFDEFLVGNSYIKESVYERQRDLLR